MSLERENLNLISNVGHSIGVNAEMVAYTYKVLCRHMSGESVLELGPAEGVMTELLVNSGRKVTIVEGAESFCKSIGKRFPTVKIHNCLFEEFQPAGTFDNIVLGHVLEHVIDPVDIVKRARTWLTPNKGKIFAAVPNCRSLHRQAAVIMGMLTQEDALNEADFKHGHRRVFSPESFRNVFYQAGVNLELFGGYWLKPLSNKQIEEGWNSKMLEAFMQLGERYPDIAAEIYVVAGI